MCPLDLSEQELHRFVFDEHLELSGFEVRLLVQLHLRDRDPALLQKFEFLVAKRELRLALMIVGQVGYPD